MGGFFGGGGTAQRAVAQPAKPYVQPAAAIRSEEQESGKKEKKENGFWRSSNNVDGYTRVNNIWRKQINEIFIRRLICLLQTNVQ